MKASIRRTTAWLSIGIRLIVSLTLLWFGRVCLGATGPSQGKNALQLKAMPLAALKRSMSSAVDQQVSLPQEFQIANRRGRDPFRKRVSRHLQNADMNGGNTNYLLTIPIMTLPGRGLNVALSLFYNSQVWTTQGTSLVFDKDDWPAAGWSLSLGKLSDLPLTGAHCRMPTELFTRSPAMISKRTTEYGG